VPSSIDNTQPVKDLHVDGVACPHLNVCELRTFTLLVGVLLSEVPEPSAGALHYVRGGHLRMAQWFATDWKLGTSDQVPSCLTMETTTPFLGAPGDVIFMHHLVPHAVGRNMAAVPRFMLYYRLSHERHSENVIGALRDPWLEFPALRERGL
jgi:hypothetical protein